MAATSQAVVPVALLVINYFIMMHYLEPDSNKGIWPGKIFFMLGMLIAQATVLLLPMDIGNRSGIVGCGFWNDDCGGLNMAVVWQIIYILVAVMVIVVIPFAILFYETDDALPEERQGAAARAALRCSCGGVSRSVAVATVYTLITLVLSSVVILVTWALLAKTDIPYKATTVNVTTVAFVDASSAVSMSDACGTGSCTFADASLSFDVSFIIFLAGLLSFVGWFLFVIYGGIGLVAVPMDAINNFRHRPRFLSSAALHQRQRYVRDRALEAIRVGTALAQEMVNFAQEQHSKGERREQRKVDATSINRYRVMVEYLEEEYERTRLSDPAAFKREYNPFIPWLKLVGGVIGAIVSLLWVIHIIIFMLVDPPLTPFLNDYFNFFDRYFAFIGTLSIALFAMYLLIAVMKGAFKFGSRFFIIKVHPMVPKRTLLNSLFFNLGLVMLCCLPVVQFTSEAFSSYARLTDANLIFGNQIKHLRFFRYFFENDVFVIVMLVILFLALIYFSVSSSDKTRVEQMFERGSERTKQEMQGMNRQVRARGGGFVSASGTRAVEMTRGGNTGALRGEP